MSSELEELYQDVILDHGKRPRNARVIEGATFDNLDHFANELFDYLVYYNNHRPHQSLGGSTPKAFADASSKIASSAN